MSKAPVAQMTGEYSYRCGCGAPAFIETSPGHYLCRRCLAQRESKTYLPDEAELRQLARENL